MAEITYSALKKQIGQKLELIADSEDLQSGDDAIIAQKCLSVQAQIEMAGITSFAVEFGLEEAYADVFGDLVAAECAAPFALPEPRRSALSQQRLGMPGRSPAERRLRSMFIQTKQYTKTDVTVV